jgi:hypothetical protein
MSTLAYAALTTRRDFATRGTSATSAAPGVQTYVDALAALVPTEALALHAAIISGTTKIKDGVTTISAPDVLNAAFWGLIAASMLLYVLSRLRAKTLDKLDCVRALIPACAFVGWMMLQRVTAFDVAFPTFAALDEGAARSVAGLFLAVVLGGAAAMLAYKADQKP